jgi:peptidoglycan hydrolase CwlO-like protein
MKENKTTILLVIVLGLMVWNLFTTSQIKTDVAGYNQKIDSIQKEVDSVYTVNKQIDKQIDTVNTKIVNVENNIESVKENITIIKNNTDEQVNNANILGNVELQQLLTGRYN